MIEGSDDFLCYNEIEKNICPQGVPSHVAL